MDGFTGLDPQRAQQDIRNFSDTMKTVARMLHEGGNEFFNTLSKNWYSPKAVEFSEKYNTSLYEGTVEVVENCASRIAASAIEAYNSMAAAQGLGTIPYEGDMKPGIQYYFGNLSESGPNGVGMNQDAVKTSLAEYQNRVKNAISILDSLSGTISLFDRTGSIQSLYSATLDKMKGTINNAVESITKDILMAIENEQQLLDNAVGSSSDALGGFGSGGGFGFGGGFGSSGGFGFGGGSDVSSSIPPSTPTQGNTPSQPYNPNGGSGGHDF